MENQQPILSVCVRSYNQRDFLKIAIDSILSQKTSFDFDIIISDDCSQDGTIEMLHNYEEQYPTKIRLVLGEHNIGGPLNFKRVIEAAQSKYVAFMDGDDYWVDEYKLQKQYDIMQSHPEYVGCFHNAYTISEKSNDNISLFNNKFLNQTISYAPIVTEHWFMPTSSEFVVREKIIFPDWYIEVPNDDYVINLGLAMAGDFCYLPDVMSVYRYHSQNISIIYNNRITFLSYYLRIIKEYFKLYPSSKKEVLQNAIAKSTKEYNKLIIESRHLWLRYFKVSFYKQKIFKLISHIG